VLFGVPMTAYEVNHHYFGLWASWLLFSIMVTMIFGMLLVISSTSGANSNKIQHRPRKTSWLGGRITDWDPKGDKRRLINFVTAFVICSLLVIFSEMQVNRNCVFNENSQWGFGQVSASPAQHSNLLNCRRCIACCPAFCTCTGVEYCRI
jgi:hypothetical protein